MESGPEKLRAETGAPEHEMGQRRVNGEDGNKREGGGGGSGDGKPQPSGLVLLPPRSWSG